MKLLKKILIISAGALLALILPSSAYAVPVSVPSAPGSGYLLQSVSSGNYNYANLTAGTNVTLSTTSSNITISATGGGGSGGGTWSTTTSQVTGQLINYPNNTTDIPCIGGTATTTCKFYFNPNTSTSLIPYASTTAVSATNMYVSSIPLADCVQGGASGLLSHTTAACGQGTVNGGTMGSLAWYASGGTAVSPTTTAGTAFGWILATTTTATSSFAGYLTVGTTTSPVAANGSPYSITDQYNGIAANVDLDGNDDPGLVLSQNGIVGEYIFSTTNPGDFLNGAKQWDGGFRVERGNFDVGFPTGSIALLVASSTHNVGISSTSPTYTLSVEGSSSLGNSATAGYFTATTTTASTFPVLTVSGTSGLTLSALGGTQCLHEVGGVVGGTGSDCGSGGGSAYPFTPSTFGSTNTSATSTAINDTAGLISVASSTISLLTSINATTTNATTTNEYVKRYETINGADGSNNGLEVPNGGVYSGTGLTALNNLYASQDSTVYLETPDSSVSPDTIAHDVDIIAGTDDNAQTQDGNINIETRDMLGRGNGQINLDNLSGGSINVTTAGGVVISGTEGVTISQLGGSGTSCVQTNNSGVVSATGMACGGGSSQWSGTAGSPIYYNSANVGVASSSPWAKFSIGDPVYNANQPMFAISSTTASGATTTPFYIGPSGAVGYSTTSPENAPCSAQVCHQIAPSGTNMYPNFVNFMSGNTSEFSVSNAGALTLKGNISLNGNITYQASGNISGSPVITGSGGGGFTTNSATGVAFTAIGAAAQSVDIMDVKNSSGTKLDVFNSTGLAGFGTSTPSSQAIVTVSEAATTTNAEILVGSPNQTGGEIVVVDATAGHSTCTEIYTVAGTILGKVVTCPTQ